jgi:hypothetical protein
MLRKRIILAYSVLSVLATLSIAAAPAAFAQRGEDRPHEQGRDAPRREDDRRADRDREFDRRGPDIVVPAPAIAPQVQAVPVPAPVVVPQIQAVPVPVPALQPVVMPALEQVFPTVDFGQYPPQFLSFGDNSYVLSNPPVFCGVDDAGTCQFEAQQLAQIMPGWGTAVLNGPQGYGVYLTYQGSF